MQNSLLTVWAGPLVQWEGVLGDLQGKEVSVSQGDGVSRMAQACQLCGSVERGFKKGTVASAHLSIWRKLLPSSLLDTRHFSFFLYATGALQAATPVVELRGSECE